MKPNIPGLKGKRGSLVKHDFLRIGGRAVPVVARTNPRATRLIVRVHPTTGEVAVVAPSRHALERALDFARDEVEWIAGRLAAIPQPVMLRPGDVVPYRGRDCIIRHDPEARRGVFLDSGPRKAFINVSGEAAHVPRRVKDWLRAESRREVCEAVRRYAKALGVAPRRVTLRDPTTRWGSCSTNGVLSFSWRLILAPPFVLDYVAAHEVAHLIHMNHGPRFWTLVEQLVGDTERPRQWLRMEGAHMHRYGPADAAAAQGRRPKGH
jgi:predicted metal-dependent hydrolase